MNNNLVNNNYYEIINYIQGFYLFLKIENQLKFNGNFKQKFRTQLNTIKNEEFDNFFNLLITQIPDFNDNNFLKKTNDITNKLISKSSNLNKEELVYKLNEEYLIHILNNDLQSLDNNLIRKIIETIVINFEDNLLFKNNINILKLDQNYEKFINSFITNLFKIMTKNEVLLKLDDHNFMKAIDKENKIVSKHDNIFNGDSKTYKEFKIYIKNFLDGNELDKIISDELRNKTNNLNQNDIDNKYNNFLKYRIEEDLFISILKKIFNNFLMKDKFNDKEINKLVILFISIRKIEDTFKNITNDPSLLFTLLTANNKNSREIIIDIIFSLNYNFPNSEIRDILNKDLYTLYYFLQLDGKNQKIILKTFSQEFDSNYKIQWIIKSFSNLLKGTIQMSTRFKFAENKYYKSSVQDLIVSIIKFTFDKHKGFQNILKISYKEDYNIKQTHNDNFLHVTTYYSEKEKLYINNDSKYQNLKSEPTLVTTDKQSNIPDLSIKDNRSQSDQIISTPNTSTMDP